MICDKKCILKMQKKQIIAFLSFVNISNKVK